MRIVTEQPWRQQAACRKHPELDWTPSSPTGGVSLEFKRNLDECVAVCLACPVFDECKKESEKELAGVWAGKLLDRRPPAERRVAKCGTIGGYRGHYRRGEPACDECKVAHIDYRDQLAAAARAQSVANVRQLFGRSA